MSATEMTHCPAMQQQQQHRVGTSDEQLIKIF